MPGQPRSQFHVAPVYQPILREIGLDAESIFDDPRIVVWRSITERQNCTIDHVREDGTKVRLHIKRYLPARGAISPAEEEANGIRALDDESIPTLALVGWGTLTDGRSFVITEELYGFRPADKAIGEGVAFEELLEPTADLAALLHGRGLHHRDLYLCHFFIRMENDKPELRLIDAARVRRLGNFLTRRRWIVKDLAQFWYSTLSLPISDEQRTRWLDRYGRQRGLKSVAALRKSIERKARWIARHDAKLKAAQPKRNISIPESGPGA